MAFRLPFGLRSASVILLGVLVGIPTLVFPSVTHLRLLDRLIQLFPTC